MSAKRHHGATSADTHSKRINGKSPTHSNEPEQFQMPRSLAWQFALRGIHEYAHSEAAGELLKATNAAKVKDVQVDIKCLNRKHHAMRLPAYIISYEYGKL